MLDNGSSQLIGRFRRVVENPCEYAKSLKDSGYNLAGYMCTHVPEEILYAAGIVPVRILASHVPQATTRGYIHETYCSFSHDCAYQGLFGKYDFLNLIVTTSSCIHMGEAFNVWNRFAGFQNRSYLIPYPHIIETKPAPDFMRESFGKFKEFVEGLVKRSITDQDLERSIRIYNDTRKLLKKLWELFRAENSPLNGSAAATITLASQIMDKQEYNRMLEDLIRRLAFEPLRKSEGVRLMVSAGACDNPAVFDLMESLHFDTRLVFVDSCTVARYFWFEVPEERPDKLRALVEGYICRIPCPAKDNVPGIGEKKRLRFLLQFIESYRPDGVVFLYQRFCSPQPMDVVAFKPVLEKMGIPSIDFELDTTLPVTLFRTQLEAFIESIRG